MLSVDREIAASRFLGELTTQMRRQALALPSVLATTPDAIPIFTARKAVCLADSLRRLRLWQPTCDFSSTRALDGDIRSLAGAKAIVVEDIAASGRSLKRTIDQLAAAGVEIEGAFALSIEGDRKAWEETIGCPLIGPTLTSSPAESLMHTDSVVRAFGSLPRPYNVDWPIYQAETRLSKDEVRRLNLRPHIDIQSSPIAAVNTLDLDSNLALRMVSFDSDIANLIRHSVGLAKIRVHDIPNSSGSLYVPIFSLGNMSAQTLDHLFDSLCGKLAVSRTGLSRSLKYRIAQFILSDLFLKSATLPYRDRLLVEDATHQYLFLPQDRDFVLRLQHAITELVVSESPTRKRRPSIPAAAAMSGLLAHHVLDKAAINLADSLLSEKFLSAYVQTEEHQLRSSLRDQTRADERTKIVRRLAELDRGEDGASFTVKDLVSYLRTSEQWRNHSPTVRPERAVSMFLDRAIDSGEIVPDTVDQDGVIGRRFRSGEIIEFHKERAAVAELVIRTMMDVSGRDTISTDLAQKTIIALFRYLLKKQALVDLRPMRGESPAALQFRYHLRGITLSGVETDFVGSRGTPESLSLLERWEVLIPTGNGYTVPESPRLDIGHELRADAVGVGTILGMILRLTGDDGGRLLDVNDLSFLVTLVENEDEVLAIAAEIYLCLGQWSGEFPQSPKARRLLTEATHQALAKSAWALDGRSEKLLRAIDRRIDRAFDEQGEMAGRLLAGFWMGVNVSLRPTGKDSGLRKTLRSQAVWALSAYFCLLAAEGVRSGGLAADRCAAALDNRAFVVLRRRLKDAPRSVQYFAEKIRNTSTTADGVPIEDCEVALRDIRSQVLDHGERLLEEAYRVFARSNLAEAKSGTVANVILTDALSGGATALLREQPGVREVFVATAGSQFPEGVLLISLRPRWTSEELRGLTKFAMEHGRSLWFFPMLSPPFQPFVTRTSATLYIPKSFRDLAGQVLDLTQAFASEVFVIRPSTVAHQRSRLVGLHPEVSMEFYSGHRSWTCSSSAWSEGTLSLSSPSLLSIGSSALIPDATGPALLPILTSILRGIDALRTSAGRTSADLQTQNELLQESGEAIAILRQDVQTLCGSIEDGKVVTQEDLDAIMRMLTEASGAGALGRATLLDFVNGANASLLASLLVELIK